jgi:hypothetical protein
MKRTKPKPKCAPNLTLDAETFARMLRLWRENGWQTALAKQRKAA